MIFIETSAFTRRITALLSDVDYSQLQAYLIAFPDAGDLIPGSGGLRKVRWSAAGHGKRGGARVIYFWAVGPEQIFLLRAYAKNERSDLTKDEIKELSRLIKKEYG